MKEIIGSLVSSEIASLNLKEKMTNFLVTKKKRGTYQALSECGLEEEEIIKDIKEYIISWVYEEVTFGKIKEIIAKEIKGQLPLELSRRGFSEIIRQI